MIDGKNFFDQLINNNLKTYENIRNIFYYAISISKIITK